MALQGFEPGTAAPSATVHPPPQLDWHGGDHSASKPSCIYGQNVVEPLHHGLNLPDREELTLQAYAKSHLLSTHGLTNVCLGQLVAAEASSCLAERCSPSYSSAVLPLLPHLKPQVLPVSACRHATA